MMLGYVTHVMLCYITHDYVMLYNTWYECYRTHIMLSYKTHMSCCIAHVMLCYITPDMLCNTWYYITHDVYVI